MSDALLDAVEALRLACPPEAPAPGAQRPAVAAGRRDAIVAAARKLSSALGSAPPLIPLQLEVLLQQTTHLLSVVRVWEESGTAEAAVASTLCCVRRLLRVQLLSADGSTDSDSGIGSLLSAPAARPATCELLSTLLVAASDARASKLRASSVRAVWRALLLPLDDPMARWVLPGVATQVHTVPSPALPAATRRRTVAWSDPDFYQIPVHALHLNRLGVL